MTQDAQASNNRLLLTIVGVLAIIATASVTALVVGGGKGSGSGGSAGVSEGEVQRIVTSFLKENPEVIVDAFTEARKAQERTATESAEKNIRSRSNEIYNDPDSPAVGNLDGDVTIVKWSDYNCGFCKRVMPDLLALLEQDKNIKLVVKDMPILGDQSVVNAKAAMGVHSIAPDKYFEFHQRMLKTTPRNEAQIKALAEKVGVDGDALLEEMKKPKYDTRIQKNIALAQSIGVRGTPAFVINGEFIRGAIDLETFKRRVAVARGQTNG